MRKPPLLCLPPVKKTDRGRMHVRLNAERRREKAAFGSVRKAAAGENFCLSPFS